MQQWLFKQAMNIYADFYLYYTPTTAEHDGGILIAQDAPSSDYKLARPDRLGKGNTVEQNFNQIRIHTLPHLPVLTN